jgi:hypothetical protein
MSIFHTMLNGWRRFLNRFAVDPPRPTLMEDMCGTYRAELALATLCTQHAQQMYYPQFRAELLRIAAEVRGHLPWLREQIFALGGSLPPSPPSLIQGGNSWECCRRDEEEARRGCVRVLGAIHRAELDHPRIAAGFRRIREDKVRHREEFRRIMVKSDPYAIPAVRPLTADETHRIQAEP